MIASIFTPLQRLLANPKLPWMMLWIGLALLIIALVVMIRTSWGQSRPLRKCAALSMLAHLLLACYATTIEIVMSPGPLHGRGNMNVTLVDGTEDGVNDPLADPYGELLNGSAAGELADAVAEPLERPDTDRTENERTAETAEAPLAEPGALQPIAAAVAFPPLLEIANAKPQAAPATPIDESTPAEKAPAENLTAQLPQPATPALAPADSMEDRAAAVAKPSEALPPVDGMTSLAKLPEPPTTNENGEWLAGTPSAGAGAPLTTPLQIGADAKILPQTNPLRTGETVGPVEESVSAPIASKAIPEIYADRVARDRAAIAQRYGGSPEGEASVQAALLWLANNQSADGRWDPDLFGAGKENVVLGHNRQGAGAKADTGVTGLALLAFLAAGNTHRAGEYASNVERGLEFLVKSQGADGNLGGDAELFAFMYSHGMATLAMSEAYAMTGDRRWEPAVRKAVGYTVAAQLPSTGGWRYQAREKSVELGDTSQLGWQVMALKSAEMAGIEIPARVQDGAIRYLKIVSTGAHGGKASYQPGPPKPTYAMTAEALVCRQFLGMARENPASNEAGDYLMQDLPTPKRINLYYWYYGTLGMFQLQGEHWDRWNQAMQTTLLSRQRTDGDLSGSWDPDCQWGGYGGRVYSTALSSLCLEVYYRYLPIYRTADQRQPTATR